MVSLANAYVINKSKETRRASDAYFTPPIVTYVLAQNEDIPNDILEPCAGRGWISAELTRLGNEVYSSDLVAYENSLVDVNTGIDCLDVLNWCNEGKNPYGALITNPPYAKKMPIKMLRKAVDNFDFVAMVLRTTFLESRDRNKFFNEFPPSVVYVFSDRMNCDFEDDLENKQIGGMVSYSIFVWKKGNHEAKIKWLLLSEYLDKWRQSGALEYYDSIRRNQK
jgi:hypothetical protein